MSNYIIMFLLLTGLSSCDLFELRGFFTSYESVNTRFEKSMERNMTDGYTEIDLSANEYSIYVMGDSHVGGTRNLKKFLNRAREMNTAAVVIVGDLTTGHAMDYKIFSEQLPPKDTLLYFAVPGNHDLYFDGWKSFYSFFGPSAYYFSVNTPGSVDLFICLDTGGGTLGNKQIEWLKQLLKNKRDNYRYCVIFTHVNLFRFRPTTSTNPMVEEIHALTDLFLRYNVNMVVTGHDHKRNTDRLGNTTFIITDASLDTNSNASYLVLTLNGEGIDHSFSEF